VPLGRCGRRPAPAATAGTPDVYSLSERTGDGVGGRAHAEQGVGGPPQSVELIEKEKRGGFAASCSRATTRSLVPLGVSGSSPHFSSGRPEPGLRGTRSGSALSWWRGRAWWSARSRISGALAVAERIGLSRSEEEGTCRSAVGHAPPAPAPRPRAPGCARSGACKRRPASASPASIRSGIVRDSESRSVRCRSVRSGTWPEPFAARPGGAASRRAACRASPHPVSQPGLRRGRRHDR
jgi:hypothetical protein